MTNEFEDIFSISYIYINHNAVAMRIREDFHQLIDSIEDESVLKEYYDLLQNLNGDQNGELWNKLSSSQKLDLLIAEEESHDENNLIPHEEARKVYSEWLRK